MARIDYTSLVNKINELNTSLAKYLELSKQINEVNKQTKKTDDGKELKRKNENTKALNTNTQKLTSTQKELQKAEISLEKQRQKGLAVMAKQEHAQRELIKASRLEIKSEDDLIKRTNALVKLRRQADKTTKEGRESIKRMTAEINKNTIALKKSDAAIGRAQRGVGGYLKAIMKSVLAMGAMFLGFQSLIRVVRNVVGIFVNFEKAQSKLASILGTTSKQIKELTLDAKRLGASTKFTASEVSGLQTELAKLGFKRNEILNATEDILSLAAATGTELARAAEITGTAIRSFGLDASEAGRVTDVFAASTSRTALTMEKLANSLPKVGAVAKKLGFSLEGTVALLGKLADSGFEASTAGTSLRSIMLNLADSNGKLAKELGRSVTNVDELIPALIELRDKGVDLNDVLQLTDKRSVAAFSTFLEGAEAAKELKDSLLDVQGVAAEMAREQLDNLAGKTAILKSAWEGLVLSIDDGTGALSGFLKSIVTGATKLINFATKNEKLSDSLRKEQLELNALIGALTSSNNSEDSRSRLMTELITKYPDFLKGLDTEKRTNEDIRDRLIEVNAEYTKRINLLAQQELTARKYKEIINLQLEEVELVKEADAVTQKFHSNFAGTASIMSFEYKKALKALKENRDEQVKLDDQLEVDLILLKQLQAARKKLREETEELIEAEDELIEAEDELNFKRETNFERLKSNKAKEIKLNDEIKEQTIATEEETANFIINIKTWLKEKLAGFREEEAEQEIITAQIIADQKREIANRLFDFTTALNDRALLNLEEKNKKGIISDEKFAIKSAKIKRRQAFLDKAIALFNIFVDTRAAIVGFLDNPGGIPGLALSIGAGVIGAIAAATVFAQKIPSYFKGIVGIKGKGTETSDSIPTNLSKNESVIIAKGTKRMRNTLIATNKELSNTEIINALATDLNLNPDVMFGSNVVMPVINDERLLKVMAENTMYQKKLYELELSKPMSIFTEEGKSAIIYKNTTYINN